MDVFILLNIFLGACLATCSFVYWKKIGGWLPFWQILIGLGVAGIYLVRLFLVPTVVTHSEFGFYLVRPAFTGILIVFTAKGLAAAKRVRSYDASN